MDPPEDRGIKLSDVLLDDTDDHGYELKDLSESEMLYMVRQTRDGRNHFDFGHCSNADNIKSSCVLANWHKGVPYNVLVQRIGTITSVAKNQTKHDSKQYRVYHPDGKSCTLCGEGGGVGAKTGLYLCPTRRAEGIYYEVKDHIITVAGDQYYINLDDGLYRVRKLHPVEAERLQTLPDGYTGVVSATQRLRGLGNGWTAEVILHILRGALGNVSRDEHIQVLSMYDGIGTGRYCLDKMGFTNVEYHAYEIDKYSIKVAMSNYPDIIQHGDAFQVRGDDWSISN